MESKAIMSTFNCVELTKGFVLATLQDIMLWMNLSKELVNLLAAGFHVFFKSLILTQVDFIRFCDVQ